MIDKQVMEDYLNLRQMVESASVWALKWYNDNVEEVKALNFLEYTGIDRENNVVYFIGEEPWRYGGKCYFELPIDVLYDSSVRDRLVQEEQERKRKREQEKEQLVEKM